MGKKGKKQQQSRGGSRRGGATSYFNGEDDDNSNDCTYPPSSTLSDQEKEEENQVVDGDDDDSQEEDLNDLNPSSNGTPSKFLLYQQSVQSPKGDISYLQKFFLMYVGGRMPIHLQEDFCGTALLSAEWLRSDSRRTAVGLDLDLDALNWCMETNISKVGADGYSRISLFHGNVLQPLDAKLVEFDPRKLIADIKLGECNENSAPEPTMEVCSGPPVLIKHIHMLPARDIVCAFNYSCCCLHKRAELVLYFKHAIGALSKKGGIFVMDLYGGTSSERELKLQRRFPNFTYVWEQAEFDIIERKTRISLHFHLQNPKKKIRHAFSYSWRLWSLPEIKDCLEEAGFKSVHYWLRHMPDTEKMKSTRGFGVGKDVKYEEVESFHQEDAWNAYIVGVANC